MDEIRSTVTINFPKHFKLVTRTIGTPAGSYVMVGFEDPSVTLWFHADGDQLVYTPAKKEEKTDAG